MELIKSIDIRDLPESIAKDIETVRSVKHLGTAKKAAVFMLSDYGPLIEKYNAVKLELQILQADIRKERSILLAKSVADADFERLLKKLLTGK